MTGPVTAQFPCEHLSPSRRTDHGMIVLLSLSLGALGFRHSHLSLLLQGVVEGNVLLWDALATERSQGDRTTEC